MAEGSDAHRGRADRLVQGQGRPLQGADVGRVPRDARPDGDRQAAEVQAARAVLGGPRPPGQLTARLRSALYGPTRGADARRGRRPAPRLVPARDRGRLGRGRAGGRRPRRRRTTGAARGRPGAAGGAARRPSGAPTCWWSTTRCSCAACTASRETTPKGRTLATLHARRLRAAHRPHQRRPGGRRRLRRPGRGARACADRHADRAPSGPPLDKLVVFVPVADAERGPRGAGRRGRRP